MREGKDIKQKGECPRRLRFISESLWVSYEHKNGKRTYLQVGKKAGG